MGGNEKGTDPRVTISPISRKAICLALRLPAGRAVSSKQMSRRVEQKKQAGKDPAES
jgi:hypothetical protein